MPDDNSDEALPENYQDFPDGSLLRIIFHNFLTYEHTSFLPTASLNMILGHNGSGKSSIICGICLACGGSPKSLGRSEKITEYIRHGCTEGYVEIAIADKEKGPQTVRLTIRIGKAPEYRLNNSIVTQGIVNELRKTYNIQIDNPCAFLAQDKVKSFSEQSSIELLKNTEKAASEDLCKRHDDLMEQRKDSTTIEDKCTSSEKALKHLNDEITKVAPYVENYRKKVALQSKLRLLEKKLKFMEFESAETDYREELKKMDDAMVEYREVEKKIEVGEKMKKKLDERSKSERSVLTQLQDSIQDLLSKISQNMDKNIVSKTMEKAKMRLESAKNASEKHSRDIEKTKKSIENAQLKWEAATEELKGNADFQDKLKKMEDKFVQKEKENRLEEDAIQKKSYDIRVLENKYRDLDYETKQNSRDRLQVLQSYFPDAAKAYQWYKTNRKEFKEDVYLPLMDMILTSPDSAKALENSVGMRDRCMFVCQNRDDEMKLNGSHQTWKINTTIVTSDRIRNDEINSRVPSELENLGFKFFVTSSYEAPPPLKQYLCNVSALDRIPFGGDQVEKNIGESAKMLERMRILVFLTNSLRCQITRSKYSDQTTQSQSSMRDPKMFREQCFRKSPIQKSGGDDLLKEIEDLKAEISVRTEQLHEKRRAIQKEKDILRNEQIEWKSKKQIEMKWKTELSLEKRKLQSLEEENIDIDTAEKEFESAKQKSIEDTTKMFENSIKWQKEYLQKYRELGRRYIVDAFCRNKITKLMLESGSQRERLDELKGMKSTAEDQLKMALNRKKLASAALSSACNLQHLNEEKMTPNEKKILAKLLKLFEEAGVPTDLDDLEKAINSENTRLKLAEDSGEDGSIQHEQQMERLQTEFAAEKIKQEKLIENRERLHSELGAEINTWRHEVEKMIGKINENYLKFFESLGCRGEVSLDIPENPLDIEKYGIMIMVCFRKGEIMKRLDNRVQSGGERSVATMLYLLALQQLCPVPFRCIDEINQGMDPTNERKVFEIMVGLWNGSDGQLTKTQYFLLSPKLLHGLDMRDHVNVVMVNSTLTDFHGKHYDTESKISATFASMGINV